MTKYITTILLLIFTSTLVLAQDASTEKASEEKIIQAIDLLYTIDDFRLRFEQALEQNPNFSDHVENEEYISELTRMAGETAVSRYAANIHQLFLEHYSANQLDSLISVLSSPYGGQIKKLFWLDNSIVEKDVAVYVNEIINAAFENIHLRDSLRFSSTYPDDLSVSMQGHFVDTLFNGIEVKTHRVNNIQTESANGLKQTYKVNWTSNNQYTLVDDLNNQLKLQPDTLKVTIYEVDGNVYKYICRFPDRTYVKSTMHRQGALTPTEDVFKFRYDLNEKYSSATESPLDASLIKTFEEKGRHPFFPVNLKYRIEADFETFENPETIEMPTSSEKKAVYQVYGKASFKLDGKDIELLVYKSERLADDPKYKNHLFLPFRDLTTGEETYGGGRYINLQIPESGNKILIDFNQAYQPYCAYTTGYSCPVPPRENTMEVRIEAGVRHLELGE